MKVFNIVKGGDIEKITLDYGETKTIKLNIPNYTSKVIVCYLKPDSALDIITDFDYANGLDILVNYSSGYNEITIKLNGDNIPLSDGNVRYIEASAQGISLFSLTEITNE